jgi:hypothetical protein
MKIERGIPIKQPLFIEWQRGWKTAQLWVGEKFDNLKLVTV